MIIDNDKNVQALNGKLVHCKELQIDYENSGNEIFLPHHIWNFDSFDPSDVYPEAQPIA